MTSSNRGGETLRVRVSPAAEADDGRGKPVHRDDAPIATFDEQDAGSRPQMTIRNASAILFFWALALTAMLPSAQADDWVQKTKLQFDHPIEIPGAVLPAGAYWFALQDGPFDHNLVRIFSADRSRIEATVWTVQICLQQSIDKTEIEFAERPQQKPEALLKWYIPGRLTGRRFLYSPTHEQEFARDAKEDVSVGSCFGDSLD